MVLPNSRNSEAKRGIMTKKVNFALLLGVVIFTMCLIHKDISTSTSTTTNVKNDADNKEPNLRNTKFIQKHVQHSAFDGHAGARKEPFPMPIKHKKYQIFQPFYDMEETLKDMPFIAPPEDFIKIFQKRIEWVDTLVKEKTKQLSEMSSHEHATLMYIQMIKSFVSGAMFNDAEMSIKPQILHTTEFVAENLDLDRRKNGDDWTYAGDTMTGWARLDNVYTLLKDVISNDIQGDYIETGVWRGGSSLFAKATMHALDPSSNRISYVCDSFSGLPPGKKELDKKDIGWDQIPYLEVSSETVANNFIKYGMLDENVVFAKGFFNETMPPLKEKIDKLAIIRFDVSNCLAGEL